MDENLGEDMFHGYHGLRIYSARLSADKKALLAGSGRLP